MNSVDKIILGCGNFGGVGSLPELTGKGESRKQAFTLMGIARDLGITKFDTANSYGQGASETFLGEWLSTHSSSIRQKMKISTKVGNPYGARTGQVALSAGEIEYQARRSLRRLGVEQIQLYYLHEFPQAELLEETLGALDKLIVSGYIASFGLSNVGAQQVQSVLQMAGPALARHFACVQNEFHYLNTQDLVELIPLLQSKGIKYSAFSPLAGGLLTGKYKTATSAPPGSRLDLRREPYDRYLTVKQFQKIERFVRKAERKNLAPATAALQFVVDNPAIDSAVIGPRKREHFETIGLV